MNLRDTPSVSRMVCGPPCLPPLSGPVLPYGIGSRVAYQ